MSISDGFSLGIGTMLFIAVVAGVGLIITESNK
jgi:hypothetical protein